MNKWKKIRIWKNDKTNGYYLIINSNGSCYKGFAKDDAFENMELINGIMEKYINENEKIKNLIDMEYINIMMVLFKKEYEKIILKDMDN